MKRSKSLLLLVGAGLLLSGGCKPLFDIRKAMYDQEKYEPLEATDFFGDRRSARPLIEGTVAQGQLKLDDHLYLGIEEVEPGEFTQAKSYPFEITADDLARGKERFEIYCSVCHGLSGNGNGMVVRRGYKWAPSFHSEKLRGMPPGYFFGVISNGYGDMQSYAHQVPVEDRWRITAYIQTLQRSQFATEQDLAAVEEAQAAAPADEETHASPEHADEHH